MACVRGMYKVKPLFVLEKLDINSPMYGLKNIQNFNDHVCSTTLSTNDPLLDEVEERQDVLLRIIAEIKGLLTQIKCELATPKIESCSTSSSVMIAAKPELSQFPIVHEVVLNASVKSPPNSLLLLNFLWRDMSFVFSWHTHSSVKGLPQSLRRFDSLPTRSNGAENQLRIRVVWKEVWNDCELIISPLNSVPHLGEVAFLRFLNRCVSPQEGVDHYSSALFDTKLDACHCLSYCENIQQSQEYYNILSEGLDKFKWLGGDNISIVDVACWSVFNNMKNPNLNPSLTRWYKDFDYLVGKK